MDTNTALSAAESPAWIVSGIPTISARDMSSSHSAGSLVSVLSEVAVEDVGAAVPVDSGTSPEVGTPTSVVVAVAVSAITSVVVVDELEVVPLLGPSSLQPMYPHDPELSAGHDAMSVTKLTVRASLWGDDGNRWLDIGAPRIEWRTRHVSVQ
jgi:hypothetical protein